MKTFGETIKTMREARGLKLREVAASVGIDPSFLSRIESGAKQATRVHVAKLATVLKEDEDKLMVLYLGQRVVYELKNEELALKVMKVAEDIIKYRVEMKSKRQRRGSKLK